jgi:hypothetical protein
LLGKSRLRESYLGNRPANSLPTFMPGYNPDLDKIHTTHGLGFLVLGILGFAMSGLRSLGD